MVGVSFSYSIYANNSPASYAVGNSSPRFELEHGHRLDQRHAHRRRIYTTPFSATNAGGAANATLTFTLAAGPAAPFIGSDATARGVVGVSFSYYIGASGSPTGHTAADLPPGLSLASTGGSISGTPTTAGVYAVAVTAANAAGAANATLTFTIAAGSAAPGFRATPRPTGRWASVSAQHPGHQPARHLHRWRVARGLSLNDRDRGRSRRAHAAGFTRCRFGRQCRGQRRHRRSRSRPRASRRLAVICERGLRRRWWNPFSASRSPPRTRPRATTLAPAPARPEFNPASGALSGTPASPGPHSPVSATNSAGTGRGSVALRHPGGAG